LAQASQVLNPKVTQGQQ